ncbi:thrombomodulin [Rhinoraja longicauda]
MLVAWVALCALVSTAVSESQEEGEPTQAVCVEGFCYTVRRERRKFNMARGACKKDGGEAAAVRTSAAADALSLLMLGAAGAHPTPRYWLGLQLHHKTCQDNSSLLRGYRWMDGGGDTQYAPWAPAGDSPCGPHCVAVVSSNQTWLQRPCNEKADGVVCEYSHNDTCPGLPGPGTLYHLPFGASGSNMSSLPPGTVAVSPGHQVLRCNASAHWVPAQPPWDCRVDNGGCQHLCTPGPPSVCTCRPGYLPEGGGGGRCRPSDLCDGAMCEHSCLVKDGSPLCSCQDGYRLDSDHKGCVDVDECLLVPCPHTCTNTLGSYRCTCPGGYRLAGDGKCEDINECSQDPCQMSCGNTQGSFTCTCQSGFQPDPLDHTKCVFYCHSKQCPARCFGVECHCPPEYILDDSTNMCHSFAGCGDHCHHCLPTPGGGGDSSKCQCEDGYRPSEDGTACEAEGSGGHQPEVDPATTTTGEPERPARAGLSLGVVLGSLFAIAVLTLVFAGVGHHLLKKRGRWQTSSKYKAANLEQDVNLSQVTTPEDHKLPYTNDNCNAGT